MLKNVTVTGATGHVGTALVTALVEHGYSVRALIHTSRIGLSDLPVETVPGDVSDQASLERAFRGAEVVFHAAARISIRRVDAELVNKVNVEGTRNVIAACRAAGVKRLIHFSSIEAFSPRPLDQVLDEDRAPEDGTTGSPYALSKSRAEAEARRAAADGMDVVILNPTAVVGPHDYRPSLMGRAFLAFASGSIPMLIDGGYDWVDVRDVAEAAISAAERAPRGGRYLIGGKWASMGEFIRLVSELSGRKPPRFTCPFFIAQATAPLTTGFSVLFGKEPLFTGYALAALKGNRNISHERAARDLGYRPRELAETVRDTWRFFVDKGFLELPMALAREA